MGNVCLCFGSEGNTNAIKSIMLDIEKQDDTQNIDALIQLIDSLLLQLKAPGESAGTSTQMEYFTSATTSASQIIDVISREADKISTSKIIEKELGHMAVNVLKNIGETHLIFLGLSLVASSLQRYLTMRSNASECMDLLEKLVELAKDVKEFEEAVPGQSKRVRNSVQVIVEGVLICSDNITKPQASRYFTASAVESQLQKTQDTIKDLRASHTFAGVNYIAKQLTKRYELSPLKLLDFEPEGIDEYVRQVKEKLDMEGSEPAVAVVLWGLGGVGKSTLAASTIQALNLKSTDFRFSRVIIDGKTPDKISHVLKLQRDIIIDLGGGKVDLRDPAEGRQRLREVMQNKSCFLFIDNVVDSHCIKELLPQKLLQLESSDKQKSDPLREKQKTKLRVIITSRENNLNPLLNIKVIESYHVEILSAEVATNLLMKTILQSEAKLHEEFGETVLVTAVAQACQGVPILLSVFGNYLKVKRTEGSYKDIHQGYIDVLQALQKGKLDKYSSGDEELLSQKLFFVYDKMRDEEAKEAFLDICSYFHGWEWDQVAHIVGESSLQALQKEKLVKRSESDAVIVHDVLRSIGTEKAKFTRLTNYEEFLRVRDDITRLQNIKGLALLSTTSLSSLDCKHLNSMHSSLRILQLGDWVRLDGPPCVDAFEELRYLQIGDLKDFPFRDASKLKKLAVFYNSSKPGMELGQLPPNLKHISHQVPYRDCNAFTKLLIKDLKSLERFQVGTMRSVCLPQGFKLPASLVNLELTGCRNLPKRFGKLTALQSLILDECDMEYLPQGFEQLSGLRHLSMECCTNLIALPDRFGSSDALIYLSLRGCTRLEKLPAGLEMLRALQNLNIADCENLSALPDVFKELSALQTLDLTGCNSLKSLPESFGRLHLKSLDLHFLISLEELPESFVDLPCLTNLSLLSCDSLQRLPKTFARLRKLEDLVIENCFKLRLSDCSVGTEAHGFQALPNLKILELINCSSVLSLPMGFGELSCLEELYVEGLPLSSLPDGFGKLKNLRILCLKRCYKLERVPQDFQNLVSLQDLTFKICPMLDGAAMDKIVQLQNCRYVSILRSTKLIERWNELKKEDEEHAMVVKSGRTNGLVEREERDRLRRVSLFSGQCIQMDSTGQQLIDHSSLSVSNNTTVVLLSGELHQGQVHQGAKTVIEDAIQRAERNGSEQLRIIHVCTRAESDGPTPDKQEEMERIRQILLLLPPEVSYAIPSTDIRRLCLIGVAFFQDEATFCHRPDQQHFTYFIGHVKDSQTLIFDKTESMHRVEFAGASDGSESSDEENEIPDNIQEFIRKQCDGRAHQSLTELPDNIQEFMKKLLEGRAHQSLNELPQMFEEFLKNICEGREHQTRSDEENDIPDKIEEFINFICEGRAHQSLPGDTIVRDPPLPNESMIGKFIEALKNNGIHHFVDNNQLMVGMDHLEGKHLAVIMIDLHSPECTKLQEIYGSIQNRGRNFETIWIALSQHEDFGFGTYSRAIQRFPGIALPDPKLIKLQDINDKTPRVIIFNQEGDVENVNALPLIMSWGADAYPFAENALTQIVSKMPIKSSLDILFHGMNFSTKKGIQDLNEIMNSKCVFFYAEPQCPQFVMNSMLEQFARTQKNIIILYVGSFFDKENDAESVNEVYDNAAQDMQWPKLSFWDMVKFWYRCMCLSTYIDKMQEKVDLNLTPLKMILKHLFIEKRWLILLDSDGIVTANGKDVVELLCRPASEEDDDVDKMIKRNLAESIENGKCKQVVRTFFKDEISDYPHHQHPLMLGWKEDEFYCDRCHVFTLCNSDEKRVYRCRDGCDWNLCFDCWEVFAKEQVEASKP